MSENMFMTGLSIDREECEHIESEIIRDTAELCILVECISEKMFMSVIQMLRESEESKEGEGNSEDVLTEKEKTIIRTIVEKVTRFIMAAVEKVTKWLAKIGTWWRMRVYKPLKENLDTFDKIDKSKVGSLKMSVLECTPSHADVLNLGTVLIIKEGEAKTTEAELHELSQLVARRKVNLELVGKWENMDGAKTELEKINKLLPNGSKAMTKEDLPKIKDHLNDVLLNGGKKVEKTGSDLYDIVSNFKQNWREEELKNRLEKGKSGIKEINEIVKEFEEAMKNLDTTPLGAQEVVYTRFMDAVMRVYAERVKTYNYIYTGGMWLCNIVAQDITKICKALNKVGGGK